VNASVARGLAEELAKAELLQTDPAGAGYRVRTDPAQLVTLLDELDRTYARQVRAVAELIHSNVGRKARSFADAFVWRKP
jgi:hypothetical protein